MRGAQRLSASSSGSRRSALWRVVQGIVGAQRLSASSSGSRLGRAIAISASEVLNAFRRHRRVHRRTWRRCQCGQSVLNAFRRHRRVHTERRALRWPALTGAQRLSASSSGSRECRERPASAPAGAQRLSASSSGSRRRLDTRHRRRGSVLNAFRRHRRVHPAASPAPTESGECSTPFGIIVGFTPTRGRTARIAPSSAQRLSASSSGSLADSSTADASSVTCSTPFGVIVGFTRPDGVACVDLRRVLNAFRRHRRVHRRRTAPGATPVELLNAFRRHRRVHARRRRLVARRRRAAQRLSASSSGSPGSARSRRRGRHQVLNAFRRHRRVHASTAVHAEPTRDVLNAFRRHRRVHGAAIRGASAFVPVLNAFRRHRRVHPPSADVHAEHASGAQRLSASSSGSRRSDARVAASMSGAQRLSASSSGSLVAATESSAAGCSTPCGVIVGFTRPVEHPRGRASCSTPCGVIVGFTVRHLAHVLPTSAQRLSASSSGSHASPAAESTRSVLLNAFRRHRRVHRPILTTVPIGCYDPWFSSTSLERRVDTRSEGLQATLPGSSQGAVIQGLR